MHESEDLPLGKETEYPKRYDPQLLSRIQRAKSRSRLYERNPSLNFGGVDLWTLYELNWINLDGSPTAVVGELRIPAQSKYTVESKSLKLYLNSLYYHQFESVEAVQSEVERVMSALVESPVELRLTSDDDYRPGERDYRFIDLDTLGADISNQLKLDAIVGERHSGEHNLYKTDCFRSLCPVTSQPDWASIYVGVSSIRLDGKGLAQYLLSYSEHNGFHESCVEQIFADILHIAEPEQLTVAARFTRRGGIDINPYRTTTDAVFEMPPRTIRQ